MLVTSMDKAQPHPLFKLATELGPLVVFFAANAKFDLFVATGAFMVAIVASIIVSYVVVRHVPLMAIVSGVICFMQRWSFGHSSSLSYPHGEQLTDAIMAYTLLPRGPHSCG